MWLKELSDSLKLSVLERSTSPALGSFLSFWLVFNWKPVIYLFYSDTNIRATLAHLSQAYSDPWFNLWYPLICSVAFVLIYPFVSAGAFGLWGVGDWCKNKLTRKLHSDRVLSAEEGDALIEENESIKGRYRAIVSEMEGDKKSQEERFSSLKKDHMENLKNTSKLEEQLKKLEQEYNLLKKANSEGRSESELLKASFEQRNEKIKELENELTLEENNTNQLRAKNQKLERLLNKSNKLEPRKELTHESNHRLFYLEGEKPTVKDQSADESKNKLLDRAGISDDIKESDRREDQK